MKVVVVTLAAVIIAGGAVYGCSQEPKSNPTPININHIPCTPKTCPTVVIPVDEEDSHPGMMDVDPCGRHWEQKGDVQFLVSNCPESDARRVRAWNNAQVSNACTVYRNHIAAIMNHLLYRGDSFDYVDPLGALSRNSPDDPTQCLELDKQFTALDIPGKLHLTVPVAPTREQESNRLLQELRTRLDAVQTSTSAK